MQYIAMVESIPDVPKYQFLWRELPIEERITAAAKAGFDGVDFWDWIDKDIDQLAGISHDNGIVINSVFGSRHGSLCNSDDHDRILEQFKESIETAERCGIRDLFLQTDEVGEGGRVVQPARVHTDAERWSELHDGVARICELVENSGVDVGLLIEPLSKEDVAGYLLRTVDETIDIVSRCNRPVLRFVFDLYHQQINEGNLIANLRRTCDRAGAIHFADVPGRGAPGTGEINMASIWRELVSLGYDGVIGFETVPGEYTTEETLAKLKEIFPWPASTNS